jgi:hypothetical protein
MLAYQDAAVTRAAVWSSRICCAVQQMRDEHGSSGNQTSRLKPGGTQSSTTTGTPLNHPGEVADEGGQL